MGHGVSRRGGCCARAALLATGAAAVLPLLGLGACSVLVDTNGLSEPDHRVDGSLEASIASDTSTTTTTTDSSVSTDASTPGERDADAAAKPFCDPAEKVRFCSQFGADFDLTKYSLLTKNGGSVTVDATQGLALPSLRAESNAPPNDSTFAALDLHLGVMTQTLHVAYDVQMIAYTDYTETTVITIGPSCVVFIVAQDPDWKLIAGCAAGAPLVSMTPVVLGEWVHIAIDLDATNGTGSVGIGSSSKKALSFGNGLTGDVEVIAGLYYAKPSSGHTSLLMDNLIVR